MSHACSIVVGTGLPCQSGVSFGTSTSRPSTLTLIFSIAGGAGLVSVVATVDIFLTQAIPPALRTTAEVKHRNNQDAIRQFAIKQPIRKRKHSTAANRIFKHRP